MAYRPWQPRLPQSFNPPRRSTPRPAQPPASRTRQTLPGPEPSSGHGRIPERRIWLQSRPRLQHRALKMRVFGNHGINQLRPGPNDANKWNAPAALAACEEYAAALIDPSVIRNNRGEMLFLLRGDSLHAVRWTDQNFGGVGPGAPIIGPRWQNFAGFPYQTAPQAASAVGIVFAADTTPPSGQSFQSLVSSSSSSSRIVPWRPRPHRIERPQPNQQPPATYPLAPVTNRVQASWSVFNRNRIAAIDVFNSSQEVQYNEDGNPATLRDLVRVSEPDDLDRRVVPWPLPSRSRVARQPENCHDRDEDYNGWSD